MSRGDGTPAPPISKGQALAEALARAGLVIERPMLDPETRTLRWLPVTGEELFQALTRDRHWRVSVERKP